jgi:hypothetical protein
MAYSKPETLLKVAAARTIPALEGAIKVALTRIIPSVSGSYFARAGYGSI